MSTDDFNRFSTVTNRADLDRMLASTAVSLHREQFGTARSKWLALQGAVVDYGRRLEQIARAESIARHPSARHSDRTHDWQATP